MDWIEGIGYLGTALTISATAMVPSFTLRRLSSGHMAVLSLVTSPGWPTMAVRSNMTGALASRSFRSSARKLAGLALASSSVRLSSPAVGTALNLMTVFSFLVLVSV